MTPEDKQKADAWMLLKDSDVVRNRIMDTMQSVFDRPEVMRWLTSKMIEAETNTMSQPLKQYFERQLERNLRMILAEGVHDRLEEIVRPMIYQAVQAHMDTVSKQLHELKKLKSKGPLHARR